MTPLKRFVGISILVVSLFGVALADGGETQGVPAAAPSPAPECTTDCSRTSTSSSAQSSPVDIVSLTDSLVTWLATSML